MEKQYTNDEIDTSLIRNGFITNILGVSMQYSPEKYIKLSKMIKPVVTGIGTDLFHVSNK